ncbi:T9SS type A sorting domain-containing protein [Luteibaculum oceani]|uniref:T9SS type A sorting domain-containing protein n=1 Tax=Luteibaculum oceani TaxID=1294296 RepID=A0A5C6V4V7_9FLAO|nr:T9SS type A sorting domain-containing protein [Luteibaculum oceani]TXC78818.1 T9SS type A sorting domain-containing protein [Luteibaculum oceani]
MLRFKTYFLSTVLTVIMFEAIGQSQNFIDTGMVWQVENVYNLEQRVGSPELIIHEYLFFKGDTTISDTVYKILVARQFKATEIQNGSTHIDSTLYEPYPKAYFFEDTISGITYMRMPDGEKAFPRFYNNLQVGDTVQYQLLELDRNGNVFTNLIVKSIAPVTYFGQIRYKIEFKYNSEIPDGYFITGLGGSNGLIKYLQWVENYDRGQINCLRYEGDYEKFFQNGGMDCEFKHSPTAISERVVRNFNFHLFPNPAKDVLNITVVNDRLQTIVVQNIAGEIVESFSGISERTLTNNPNKMAIDIKNLSEGVYLVLAVGESGYRYTLRFLKK